MKKRMFLGLSPEVDWPAILPGGKLLHEGDRHLTLVFFSAVDDLSLIHHLASLPDMPFQGKLKASFDELLFLPESPPHRVVAVHANFLELREKVAEYQKQLIAWFLEKGFDPDLRERTFLPHVTLARAPFNKEIWKESIKLPLDACFDGIHLYESLPDCLYPKRWSRYF